MQLLQRPRSGIHLCADHQRQPDSRRHGVDAILQHCQKQIRRIRPGYWKINMRVLLAGKTDISLLQHQWGDMGMQVEGNGDRHPSAQSAAQG